MIAWIALGLWPVVAFILFRRLPVPVALCVTIVAGYLLLPNGISLDLPVLPALDKTTIPTLSAAVMMLFMVGKGTPQFPVLRGWLPRDPVVLGLLAVLVFGVVQSARTNGDTLEYGERVIPGLQFYDIFSILLNFLMMFLPLFLARRVLASQEGQRVLLTTLAVAALVYSIPALYEVRMSPQLHMDLYGFFPSSFAQHMRAGGFRPTVFLNHGLALGIFLTFGIIAALGLYRAATAGQGVKWIVAAVWLLGTLVLAKSLGALIIVLALAPVVLFLRPRLQLLTAACIAGIVMTYPVLRSAHLIPLDQIMTFAEGISPDRAASFMTRLENEERLLEKAQERPLYGWGGWGRQRVFDERGRDLSLTDGAWIIELGRGGWFRYIPFFGLMCWPVIALFLSQRRRVDPICAALAVALAAKLVDLIPNSGTPPFFWLIIGALIGRLEMKVPDKEQTPQDDTPAPKAGYVRARPSADPVESPPESAYARSFAAQKRPAPETGPPARDKSAYTRAGSAQRYRR